MRLSPLIIVVMLLAGTTSASGEPPSVWHIDRESSWLRILVYRGGIMSGLGHNHVISSSDLSGLVTTSDSDSYTAELRVPVRSMAVDDADARRAEGRDFADAVAERDREATQRNMLGPKLLNAGPDAAIQVRTLHVDGMPPNVTISADVRGDHLGEKFGGVVRFPAIVAIDRDDLTITGEARLSHAELGLKPFSAALGMLKVRDDLTVRFHLVARPYVAN